MDGVEGSKLILPQVKSFPIDFLKPLSITKNVSFPYVYTVYSILYRFHNLPYSKILNQKQSLQRNIFVYVLVVMHTNSKNYSFTNKTPTVCSRLYLLFLI